MSMAKKEKQWSTNITQKNTDSATQTPIKKTEVNSCAPER
jgi:hypothetical protein